MARVRSQTRADKICTTRCSGKTTEAAQSLLTAALAVLALAAAAAADTPAAQSGRTLQPIPLEDMEVSVLAPVALQAVRFPNLLSSMVG